MLTGDNDGAARGVAGMVGIPPESVRSKLLPGEKTDCLELLKGSGFLELEEASGKNEKKVTVVAMVGDGINDAPALALSDVGFAMGLKGSSVAIEAADVVLVDSDLRKLAKAVRIGRNVRRKIIENVVFSFVIKLAIIGCELMVYGVPRDSLSSSALSPVAAYLTSPTLI